MTMRVVALLALPACVATTAVQPLHASSDCMLAIQALSEDGAKVSSVVVNAYDASSSLKFEAVKRLSFFHGGDTGNYDQCEWMTPGFHHCLVGSTDRQGLGETGSPGLHLPRSRGLHL